MEGLPQTLVQVVQLLFQPRDVSLDAATAAALRRFFSETSMVIT